MRLKLTDHDPGNGPELLCPNCGSNYMHHDKVEVCERTEDATTGLRVVVEEGRVTTDSNLAGNPSSRRHGLVIHFSCEGCHARSAIEIAQHKGNTEVRHIVTQPAPAK